LKPAVEDTKDATESDLKQEFAQFMSEMKKLTQDNQKFTSNYQLDRLLTQDFVNPYDILDLPQEAND
jgi:hypothetical protein